MSDILKVAAELLTTSISDNPEDYIKTVPKYLLMKFEKHYENQQDWAIRLRSAYDKNNAELKAKDEVIKKLRGVAEFYANAFNWTFVENGDDDENCVILDKDMEGFPPTDLTYGGKRARSVLKDIGDKCF